MAGEVTLGFASIQDEEPVLGGGLNKQRHLLGYLTGKLNWLRYDIEPGQR
jgi:hypothetical protein